MVTRIFYTFMDCFLMLPKGSVEDLENNDDNPNQNIQQDNLDQTENECDGRSFLDIADEIIKLNVHDSDELGSAKQLYKCEECEASYKIRGVLFKHTSSKHKGTCYL